MIAQLQRQLKDTDKNISEEINKGLEHDRTVDKQEIQMLKASLNEMYMKMQSSRGQDIQNEQLTKLLHKRLDSIQNQVIDMKVFQAKVLEVHTKIEAEQHKLISKVEVIQNYFQEVSQSFDSILLKEKEAKVARTTFEKAAILSTKEEVSKTQKLSITE